MKKTEHRKTFLTAIIFGFFFYAIGAESYDAPEWLLEKSPREEFIPLSENTVTGPGELQQAVTLYHQGEYRLAAHLLEKIEKLQLPDGNLDFITFLLAECYRILDLTQFSAERYKKITEEFPASSKTPASYFRMLEFSYEERNIRQADSIFQIFHTRYKFHPLYASAVYVMGKLYYRENRFGEGYQLLSQIPPSSNRHIQARFLASLCYCELKEWDKALLQLQYIRKNGKDPDILNEAAIVIGDIYNVQDNNDAAIKFYSEISPDSPRYPSVQIKIAHSYIQDKQYEQARFLALTFLTANPSSDYYFEMASILERALKGMGEREAAQKVSNNMLQQLNNGRIVFQIYEELDSLAQMEKSWQFIDLKAIRENDKDLHTTVRANLSQVNILKRQYLNILEELGIETLSEQEQARRGRLERRYLSYLRDSIKTINDSLQKMDMTLSKFKSASKQPDTIEQHMLDSLEKKLAHLQDQHSAYEHEADLVIRECLSDQAGSARQKEEDRQAQYVDWSFDQYQTHKKEMREQAKKEKKSTQSSEVPRKDTSANTTQNSSEQELMVTDSFPVNESITSERNRLINHIETLLNLYPNSRYIPQLKFRLAELYYDQASDDFARRLEQFEAQMAAGEADSLSFPEYNLLQVLQLYNDISTNYPKSRVADDAMFYRALALQKINREQDANDVLIALTEKYPESGYYVEANMNIGRFFFDNPTIENNTGYDKAEEAFRKVLYYRNHPQFVQALYHLGWCFYMKDKYEEAIAVFRYLVEEVELDFDPSKREEKQVANPLLRDEAIDYIAISFDEEGRVDDAVKFLKLIGNTNYASMVLRRIGELRIEDLDYASAVEIYRRHNIEYPFSAFAPDAAVSLIKILELQNRTRAALQERESFFNTYSRDGQWQATMRGMDSTNLPRVDSMAISIGLYIADTYYRRAQAHKSEQAYRQSAEKYTQLISKYPETPRAIEARWNLAIILDQRLNETKAAYGHYIAYSRSTKADPKRRQQAAQNAIALAQKSLPPDSLIEDGKMDIAAVKTIEAIDNYKKLFPQGQSLATVLFTEGSIFFNRKMFSNAATTYERIMALPVEKSVTTDAEFLLAQCRFGENNWASAAKRFRSVWETSKKPNQKKEAYTLLLQSLFLNAKQFAENSQYDSAATAYLHIEEQYPGSEYSDVTLYNAAESYEKSEAWEEAAKTYQLLARKYPASKLGPDALFNAAANYEKLDDFENVARMYETLIARYPKTAKAKDALFNLGFCYEKLGQVEKMAAANERYSELYPGEEDAEIMLMRSAEYYYKANMYEKARRVYGNYIRRFPENERSIEATFMLAQILEEQKKIPMAREKYLETENLNISMQKAGKAGNSYYAAEAAFNIGQIYRREFESISFTLPQSAMQKQQKKKSELLKEISKAFQRVILYKSPRMFEAAFLIGDAYEAFAKSWQKQERPKLDPIKAAVLEKDISMVTSTLLQKSFEPFSKNLELAAGLDSLKPEQRKWVDTARIALAENYVRAGIFMVSGVNEIQQAPVPREIREKPLHLFQYEKQILATLEPLLVKIRDYFYNAYRELNQYGYTGKRRDICLDKFSEINFRIPNMYDNLSVRILEQANNIPKSLSEIAREDLLFQMEDIVFELQDKAIFSYEEAKALAEQYNFGKGKWYNKIMEGLARLSPETYGKSFYATNISVSNQSWIARPDSVNNWYNASAPKDGWFQVKTLTRKHTSFSDSIQYVWLNDSTAQRLYFWHHEFINGAPRDASVYIMSPNPYKLYVNGSLTLSDTATDRTHLQVDSATGIVSLVRGGDNFLSVEITKTPKMQKGFAVVFKTLIDTTQKYNTKIELPTAAVAAQEIIQAATEGENQKTQNQKTESKQSYAKTFRNRGELENAIEDFKEKEKRITQDLRKERLEYQKLKIMNNAVEVQIKMVQKEIENLKRKMNTMKREK